MPKIIRILRSCSMKIFCKFPTVNISKLNFWLVICIAKNFIWTTLKMIFSIFRFFCSLRFQILQILSYHNKPYINGKLIYSDDFRWCINLNFKKLTLCDWFCGLGAQFRWRIFVIICWRKRVDNETKTYFWMNEKLLTFSSTNKNDLGRDSFRTNLLPLYQTYTLSLVTLENA